MKLLLPLMVLLLFTGCIGESDQLTVKEDITEVTIPKSLFDWPGIGLELVADGFAQPLYVTGSGDGSHRLFLLEQEGVIQILVDEERMERPFLDIRDRVGSGANEQGLLGIAFPVDFRTSGYFYVHYTDKEGDTIISRFSLSEEDENRGDPDSEEIILAFDQPFGNHNGGQIEFGPDGYLYIGLGDGGAAADPFGNGQDPDSLLGKILRIDVSTSPYSIPPDNPFTKGGGRPEVWALGLRNPWRFGFDKFTGGLYIGDVGQNAWEEIDYLLMGSAGANLGWNRMEGKSCFLRSCDPDEFVLPVVEYDHDLGCSVTGGYVYRGSLNSLKGIYFYGDYCSGRVWGLIRADGAWENRFLLKTDLRISSFGEDDEGDVYVVDHSGGIYRLTLEN